MTYRQSAISLFCLSIALIFVVYYKNYEIAKLRKQLVISESEVASRTVSYNSDKTVTVWHAGALWCIRLEQNGNLPVTSCRVDFFETVKGVLGSGAEDSVGVSVHRHGTN